MEDNAPQKEQENRFHQCHNLDGVFAVEGRVGEGAVLLVDDVVDSNWTLTVVSALLREARMFRGLAVRTRHRACRRLTWT